MEGMVERTVTDSQAHFRSRLTSDPAEIAAIRKAVEAFASAHGHGEPAVAEIGLVLNEAIANIIRHAYRGQSDRPIEFDAGFDPELSRLTIRIRDYGTGIQPGPLPHEKLDPMKPGGLGLICLGRLMDSIRFTPQNPGMLLELEKSL